MGEQLEIYPSVTDEIVENASQFTEFLSSETIAPVSKGLTIIPNVVKDILDAALQNKQIRIQNIQFMKKAELASEYLELHDRNAQRKYNIAMEEIRAHKDITVAEIESNKQMRLIEIQSNECIEMERLKNQYDLERQKQENQIEIFKGVLRESSERYSRKMENHEKLQKEFSVLIDALLNKMVNNTASSADYKIFEELTKLKVQALYDSFNISEGFIDMFTKGV